MSEISSQFHDGFDHVGMYAEDVYGAFAQFTRLGFTMTPPARFANEPMSTTCLLLPDTYLSVSGIYDWSSAPDWMRQGMGHGLEAFVLRTANADKSRAAIERNGSYVVDGLHEVTRWVDFPDGRTTVSFRVFRLARNTLPGIERSNICQHLTPQDLWRPGYTKHANGVREILGIVGILDDPVSQAEPYRKFFGDDNIIAGDDEITVAMKRASLTFLSPDRFARDYPDIEIPAEKDIPGLVLARFCAGPADQVVGFFKHYGTRFVRRKNVITIAPRDACGAALELVCDV